MNSNSLSLYVIKHTHTHAHAHAHTRTCTHTQHCMPGTVDQWAGGPISLCHTGFQRSLSRVYSSLKVNVRPTLISCRVCFSTECSIFGQQMYFSAWVSVGPDVHQSGIPLCPQHGVGRALVFGSLWLLGSRWMHCRLWPCSDACYFVSFGLATDVCIAFRLLAGHASLWRCLI